MKRFSKDVFDTEAAALEHAWNDYNVGNSSLDG